MIAELLVLGGAVLILLSAIGVVRFGDVFERMHALSKASTLGFLLAMLGGVVGIDNVNDLTFVALAAALQVITSPVGANLISRATYRASGIRHRVDVVDELEGVDPER
jgi:multicomponent Na+:H+ antiporter subunit G